MKTIAKKILDLKINENDIIEYGPNIFKIDNYQNYQNDKKGKLILMTSINPTQFGEGKTTTAIGLADGMNLIGEKTMLVLREPSMGPVFGRKGTATGGGKSEVVPMPQINLHFTGDFHAITAANNLVSATIDSDIYWKTLIDIDPNRVVWKRCLDLNDRALRDVEIKITKDITRKEEFTITAASNMMTILCLSKSLEDLRDRLENSLVAYSREGKPIFIKHLDIIGSLMTILKDAIKPNVVLTSEGSLTLIHGGPFANIATGTNSIISTNLGLSIADYAIVESGFGSDLGFEKYMNIINAQNDLIPSCVVMVVTLRALNLHKDFDNDFKHLNQHLKHVTLYGLNLVVAINFIDGDDVKQLEQLKTFLEQNDYTWAMNEAYIKGAVGAVELANEVVKAANKPFIFKPLIDETDTIKTKIKKIANSIYYLNSEQVIFSDLAKAKIEEIKNSNYANYPICMVKSQNSIDGNDANSVNYKLTISDLNVNTGAKFILAYTNKIFSMPGLNSDPNSKHIDLINGQVVGLK